MKLWEPSTDEIACANVSKLIDKITTKEKLKFIDFQAFRDWSAENPSIFWGYVWDFCEVIASKRFNEVLIDGDKMPGAKWFSGARLNFSENLLRYTDTQDAIVFWNEDGLQSRISYKTLKQRVEALGRSFIQLGLIPGDSVVAVVSNIPEAIIFMLAAASQGLTWASCSPEFSASGIIDRFVQIEPKVLVAINSYLYKGKRIEISGKVAEVKEALTTLITSIEVPYLQQKSRLTGFISLEEFEGLGANEDFIFRQLPADHPLARAFLWSQAQVLNTRAHLVVVVVGGVVADRESHTTSR